MPKMTDQEFDSLFREAANRMTPQPPPEDWDDMQMRLEVAERDARARNISLYSMVALLLLYSFLVPDSMKLAGVERASVVPNIKQEQVQSSRQLQSSPRESIGAEATREEVSPSGEAVTEDKIEESGIENGIPEKSNAAEKANGLATESDSHRSATHDVSESTGTGASLATSPDSSAASTTQRNAASADNSSAGASLSKGATAALLNGHTRLSDGQPAASVNKSGTGPGNASATEQINQSASNGGTSTTPQIAEVASVYGLQHDITSPSDAGGFKGNALSRNGAMDNPSAEGTPLISPSTEPLDGEVASTPATVAVAAPGKVVSFQNDARHPWFFKMALSPDFSSIDYGGASKPGINLGPLVEYGISSRFSVTTGAIWSKKIYSQPNPEKTYSRGSSTIKADMLDADCRIIDIPLNVTYYILPGKKTNFFVTVGSSSYVMLDEKYVYTVYSAYRNYEYEETYSNKNVEWFSMLNLSVGVQHQVGRRWFIQGEPFLKAPIKGVGQGKVDLASAGVFVSLKYLINP